MAVAGRVDTGIESAAETLHTAGFVRLFAAPDGDSIAAAGLLGRALAERNVPFQASVVTDRPETGTDETAVVVGFDDPDVVSLSGDERAASDRAFETARALDADPDPVLALAGAFETATDFEESDAFETARERGRIERRPGVAVPVTDPVDGICHTTLAHAPFSGNSEATADALDGYGSETDDDRRRVASILALSVCAGGTPRAAEVIEHALRPYAIESTGDRGTTPEFETVGGFADVLRTCAHERPGIALALALGHDVREAALSAWRTHTERAHRALREATTERHRGLFVARVDSAVLSTVARLLRDFRSPEPIAVAVGEERAAAAAWKPSDLGERMAEAGSAVDGAGGGNDRRGWARFEAADGFVTALREALA